MKMYFATNLKMTHIYGRADAKLFTAVRFVHKAYYIVYSCKNKLQLPTTTSKSVFEEFPKVVLANCVVHHRH